MDLQFDPVQPVKLFHIFLDFRKGLRWAMQYLSPSPPFLLCFIWFVPKPSHLRATTPSPNIWLWYFTPSLSNALSAAQLEFSSLLFELCPKAAWTDQYTSSCMCQYLQLLSSWFNASRPSSLPCRSCFQTSNLGSRRASEAFFGELVQHWWTQRTHVVLLWLWWLSVSFLCRYSNQSMGFAVVSHLISLSPGNWHPAGQGWATQLVRVGLPNPKSLISSSHHDVFILMGEKTQLQCLVAFPLYVWNKQKKTMGRKAVSEPGRSELILPQNGSCQCWWTWESPPLYLCWVLSHHNASLCVSAQKEMVKLLIMARKENMLHLLWIAVQN